MEPTAKRSKLDDSVFVLDKLKGRIVLRIERISEYLKGKPYWFNDTVHIRGFDWMLLVIPFSVPNKGLKFQIDCNGGSRADPDWNYAVSAIVQYTSGGNKVEIVREDDLKFDSASNVWLQQVSNHQNVQY